MDSNLRETQKQQERAAKKTENYEQFYKHQSITSITSFYLGQEGPDYVSVCCNRLMYCKTIQEYKVTKYGKAPEEFVAPESQDKQWICKTCHSALKRGVLPAQAKANNFELDDVSVELSDLNTLKCILFL